MTIHSIIQGIKNLIIWFPVIWKDQWWDDSFLFTMLRFKLKLMEKGFRNEGHHVGDKKNADDIRICVLLLDRIDADNYSDMAFKLHDKKWGKLKHTSTPSQTNKFLADLKFTRDNVKTKADELQEEKESSRLYKLSEYLLEQDIEYLFKVMNKRIRYWWN